MFTSLNNLIDLITDGVVARKVYPLDDGSRALVDFQYEDVSVVPTANDIMVQTNMPFDDALIVERDLYEFGAKGLTVTAQVPRPNKRVILKTVSAILGAMALLFLTLLFGPGMLVAFLILVPLYLLLIRRPWVTGDAIPVIGGLDPNVVYDDAPVDAMDAAQWEDGYDVAEEAPESRTAPVADMFNAPAPDADWVDPSEAPTQPIRIS